MTEPLTRDNFEAALDAGEIEVLMANGNWWKVRRNGKTKRWVKSPNRIQVPIKYGLKGCHTLTEYAFNPDGSMSNLYRRKA